MELSNSNLNHLENISKFMDLDVATKTIVVKHFFDFKSNFIIEKRALNELVDFDLVYVKTIQCSKCLLAPLVNQSTKGMIEHHLAHTLDNLTKLGLYNKRPIQLYLGG